MNLPVIDPQQAAPLARIAFATNRFFAVYGRPGGGKTSIPETIIAPSLGILPDQVTILNQSGYGPQETLGYGLPDHTTRDMWFSSPERWPTYKRIGDTPHLLVLDEKTEWDLQVDSLCRSLFQPTGKRPIIGTHELGTNVLIMTTGNRRNDGTRSATPNAPSVGRSLSVELRPSLDGWLDWSAGATDVDAPDDVELHRRWQSFVEYRDELAAGNMAASPAHAFLSFRNGVEGPDHFCPDVPMPWDGSPHAGSRQWEAVCRATCIPTLMPEPAVLSVMLHGLVGEAAGSAAYSFFQTVGQLLPKVAAIRNGKEPMSADPAERYALGFAALRQAVKESRHDPEAAVAGGTLDWLVDRFIIPSGGEMCRWLYTSATRIGLPLNQHPRRSVMQGV